ncbi:SLC13 family permease [Pseudogemmobacter sonorensis]|uniref:SLC13 family permease n=1 Tax=Pseudogemmobacter sonorensis TaxID=2989681 RepID=UPI0036A8C2E2
MLVALVVYALLGGAEGLSADARAVAAIATLMAIWWMTEAIPLAATSLIPIILFPALTGMSVGQATSAYANPIVFLFLGGFPIAIAMEKWNLHRRIALLTIARIGVQPRRIILVLMFILPAEGKTRMILTWKDAEDGLPWGVLLLFGGGLSLAAAVGASGLDDWFGAQVAGLGVLQSILLVAAVIGIILSLTEVTSNAATAATFVPILGGVAMGIGVDPLMLAVPAALAATCAFMLPVSTPPNAIVFGSGAVTIGQMARGGAVLNVIGVLLITATIYLLGGLALGISF